MYDTNSRDSRAEVNGPARRGDAGNGMRQLEMISLTRFLPAWLVAHASNMRHGLARRSHWPFVMRHVIYFINNKMLSATRRGGSRRQQKQNEEQLAKPTGQLGNGNGIAACCATRMEATATVCVRVMPPAPRWVGLSAGGGYCVKKKINCVRTYNRAMNQNHTSSLYIDIRLTKQHLQQQLTSAKSPCPPPARSLPFPQLSSSVYCLCATCGRLTMQIPKSEPVLFQFCSTVAACRIRWPTATHNWPQIATTINRTMQIEQCP